MLIDKAVSEWLGEAAMMLYGGTSIIMYVCWTLGSVLQWPETAQERIERETMALDERLR
jgi:hypothetical protein